MEEKKYRVAVVGALGVVGTEMISTLERRGFPVGELVPLDVAAQAGNMVAFQGRKWETKEAKAGAFKGVDIAIFSAGASASRKLAPRCSSRGSDCRGKQFRMENES